jgi:hypothetical protein
VHAEEMLLPAIVGGTIVNKDFCANDVDEPVCRD